MAAEGRCHDVISEPVIPLSKGPSEPRAFFFCPPPNPCPLPLPDLDYRKPAGVLHEKDHLSLSDFIYVGTATAALRLRLQPAARTRRRSKRRVGGSAESVSATGRSRAQSGRHRQRRGQVRTRYSAAGHSSPGRRDLGESGYERGGQSGGI